MAFSDISVNISVENVVGRLGFGIPLIVEGKTSSAAPAGNPIPVEDEIVSLVDEGSEGNPVFVAHLAHGAVSNVHVYANFGADLIAENVDYTLDYATGIITIIPGTSVFQPGVGTELTVDYSYSPASPGAPAAGHPFSTYANYSEVLEVFGADSNVSKAAKKMFEQAQPPKQIACLSTAENVVSALDAVKEEEFRQVIPVSFGAVGESTIKQVADWCELNKRMLFTSVANVADVSDMTSARETYDHVVVISNPAEDGDDATLYAFPEAALVGVTASKDIGSYTYKNQVLKNVKVNTPANTAALNALHNSGIITILKKAGDKVPSEGITYSGQYIDLVDSKDWIVQQITYQVQKVLNNEDKVPYDNTGINLLDSAVISVLKTAYDNGMIAVVNGIPAYWTEFTLREDTSAEDRVVRKYVGGNFGFTLAGAVHTAEFTGVIEI